MSNKQLVLFVGAVFSLLFLAVMIFPQSRRHMLGTVRGEPMQNGKYTSEWIAQLSDPDPDKRNDAAASLSGIDSRGRKALPELLRLVREEQDSKVRAAAAFAVYKIADGVKRNKDHATEILDTITAALDDPDALTRMNSALALGMLEGDARPALPALEKAIRRDENKSRTLIFPLTIREQMIADIGFMGADGKDGLPLLKEMLVDDEDTTRKRCAMSLGQLGPAAKEAVPLLVAAITDESESDLVRESAKEALMLIDPDAAAKLADN
jgi:HEAT repeat protein